MPQVEIGVHERPALKRWVPLSFQHVFAMFGATVLVPLVTGLSPSVALFTSGVGTLIYIVVTGAQVPVYLGSSFAFIPPIIAITASHGIPYAMGGALCAGIFYLIISGIIRLTGIGWLDRVLPPVVIGAVIIVIGLRLAPTAMNMVMFGNGAPPADAVYNLNYVLVGVVTLGIAVFASVVLKGFFTVIPILIAIVGGYLFALIMGAIFPAFDIVSFEGVKKAAWLGFTRLPGIKFGLVPVITFILVSFATIAEHLGDTLVTSKVVGKDFYKKPGIHRTLAGDGIATAFAALMGGPPNTTYGENIGVMAITRVYSVWVIGGAAVVAVVLSFIQKFGAIIQTIPVPVMGGISMMLFGIIASAGIRTVVESGVDYANKRNLTISSVILVIGIGGGKLLFPVTEQLDFLLADVALATLIGIILNLILPRGMDKPSS